MYHCFLFFMHSPSSGSLEKDVIAAVGENGLAYVCERFGQNFSLATLQREIGIMQDYPERKTLETVARVVEDAHRKLTGRLSRSDSEARRTEVESGK